jgi:hypothetical protein
MTILVMTAHGRRVRLPDGRVLTDTMEAQEVERDLFITRRLADGDLLEVPAVPAPAAAPAAKEKTR